MTRNDLPNVCTTDNSTEDSSSIVSVHASTNSIDGASTAALSPTAFGGRMASSKKRSKIPRLQTQCTEPRHSVLKSDKSADNPTSHSRKSASKACSTTSAIYKTKSRIPRLRTTTLASASRQIHPTNVIMIYILNDNTNAMIEFNPTAKLTVEHTSIDGLLQTSTVDMAITNAPAEASTDVSTSMIYLPVATDSMNGQLHPANSMGVNLAIAKDIEYLFKAFDEFEQAQRKRYEEMFPEFRFQPSDILRDSPSDTHDNEILRLKAQVASLEMDKAALTQQLELANSCIADLQHRVLVFESKNIQPSNCLDDPVEEEYARVMAIEQEIDAQLFHCDIGGEATRN
ncbi:hypothetical protein AC1031_001568 [Aphanomyces cochlioides]|nr:hypothetical protein AC1031_001568 [Aphanomyces cochlioides]